MASASTKSKHIWLNNDSFISQYIIFMWNGRRQAYAMQISLKITISSYHKKYDTEISKHIIGLATGLW